MGSGASTERPLASGKQVLEAAKSASSGTKELKLTGVRLTALPKELAVQVRPRDNVAAQAAWLLVFDSGCVSRDADARGDAKLCTSRVDQLFWG